MRKKPTLTDEDLADWLGEIEWDGDIEQDGDIKQDGDIE